MFAVAVPRSASQPAMPRVPSSNAVDKPVNQQQAPPPTRTSQSESSSPATTPQTETKTGLFSRLFKTKQQDNGAASKAKIGGCGCGDDSIKVGGVAQCGNSSTEVGGCGNDSTKIGGCGNDSTKIGGCGNDRTKIGGYGCGNDSTKIGGCGNDSTKVGGCCRVGVVMIGLRLVRVAGLVW